IQSRGLAIGELVNGERSEVVHALGDLCRGYGDWLDERRREMKDLPSHLVKVARDHLDYCDKALERMRLGVELVLENDDVWLAFHLMNVAMLRQRSRVTWLRDGRPEGGPAESGSHSW